MDLSIIIVNWNTREMLRDCLQSVFDTAADITFDVWVVDNGSSDDSQQMVRDAFPQVELIANQDNKGFAGANNQALSRAKGRHVLLLNSDTLVHGDVLSASVRYLDDNPDVGAMGCRVLNTDGTLQITGSQVPSLLNLSLQATGLNRLPGGFFDRFQMVRWDRRDARDLDVIFGGYLMVRRSVIEQVGLLDDAFFFYGEETDWCFRIAKGGWRLVLAPVGEITHFGGGSVKKLNHKRNIMLSEGTIRFHRKHYGWWGGAACWVLLGFFNLSRAIIWSLLGLAGSEKVRDTAQNFRRVVMHFREAWPRDV